MDRWRHLGLRAGLGLVLAAMSAAVFGQQTEKHWVEFGNATQLSTGNDLDLKFSAEVTGVWYERPDKSLHAGTLGNPPNTVRWTKNDLGDSVPPGEIRRILFETKAGAALQSRATESHWTFDGAIIDNSIAALGQVPRVTFDGFGNAFAEFVNPEPFDVIYSNIQLFANNDPLHFTIEDFDTPTGSLVGGLPTSITLAPLASRTLAFGAVSQSAYQLAQANVAAAATPDERFSLGSAAIPEPSAFLLAALAGVGLLAFRQKRVRPKS
jgi:hypothetical protein